MFPKKKRNDFEPSDPNNNFTINYFYIADPKLGAVMFLFVFSLIKGKSILK